MTCVGNDIVSGGAVEVRAHQEDPNMQIPDYHEVRGVLPYGQYYDLVKMAGSEVPGVAAGARNQLQAAKSGRRSSPRVELSRAAVDSIAKASGGPFAKVEARSDDQVALADLLAYDELRKSADRTVAAGAERKYRLLRGDLKGARVDGYGRVVRGDAVQRRPARPAAPASYTLGEGSAGAQDSLLLKSVADGLAQQQEVASRRERRAKRATRSAVKSIRTIRKQLERSVLTR